MEEPVMREFRSSNQKSCNMTLWVTRTGTCPDNINLFTELVHRYMQLVIGKTVHTTRVKVFPNQKPWVDQSIHKAVNAHRADNQRHGGLEVVSYNYIRW